MLSAMPAAPVHAKDGAGVSHCCRSVVVSYGTGAVTHFGFYLVILLFEF